jgi:hypothetical protein
VKGAFEATWFVYLSGAADGDNRGATIAFMPSHPSVPPGPETFNGLRMILTVELADATEPHSRVGSTGAPIAHPLTDAA